MSWNRIAVLAIPVSLVGLVACGEAAPPKSLVDARNDYYQAREGLAGRLDPTDVHEADVALQRAERAWKNAPDQPSTIDLAVVADRKALLAQSVAATLKSQQQVQLITAQIETLKTQQLQNMQQSLGVAEMQLQQERARAEAQRAELEALQVNLKDAQEAIARIASVKEDVRGMVITLPGEVLFKTGKYQLKAGATGKLNQIAAALKDKNDPIVVYGFTDNVGALDTNMILSQNRAQSVRDYLVSQGIPADLVSAQGKGPNDPVADNTSVEGRAMNRRVEIVVEPKK
ncbi:MAG TPA: OmpA family protein [Polyangiaceae bacterium]|jgi:outer membrane protein OmpA-like peptidoglycan-associated protein